MPKIIVNARQRLIDEAWRQVSESGYGSLNIRTVAKNCDISVGTVYNYFPSKDSLVTEFLISDWDKRMNGFRSAIGEKASIPTLVDMICQELRDFQTRYAGVFRSLSPKLGNSQKTYHSMLRGQLAECFSSYCADSFTVQYIAESLIVWSVEGAPTDKLSAVIEKIVA